MNKLEIHKAILHTAHMSMENILKLDDYENMGMDEKENAVAIFEMMDEEKAIVVGELKGNEWDFLCLLDAKKDKELCYLMEQNPMFGCYIDQREEFEAVYDAGEYSRDVRFCLEPNMVEIIAKGANQ